MKRTFVTLALFAAIVAVFLFGLWLGAGGEAPPQATEASVEHTCSMHPQIRRDGPGLCPICNMALIPVGADEGGDEVLSLSAGKQRQAGIRTAPVERAYPTRSIRLVGRIEHDETRLATIAAYFPGRIERLYVDYTGVAVRANDHLAEIYSPRLLAAQAELRQAAAAVRAERPTNEALAVINEATLQAAREKLRLWGLTESQIEASVAADEPPRQVTIYSPVGGVVIERHVSQGQYVDTGQPIFTVAELDHLWAVLDVFESQLQWLHYGQRVVLETDAFRGERFEGRISFIDPELHGAARSARVRVNLDNHDGRLKPGMFVRADVEARLAADGQLIDDELSGKWISPMHPEVVKDAPGSCDVCGMPLVRAEELGFVPLGGRGPAPLVIPAGAPLVTGSRAIVYVEGPEGFAPREIELGPRAGELRIVRSGLVEGERVAVEGAFRIDSEMQIRAAPSMMGRRAAPEPVVERVALDEAERQALAALFEHYLRAWDSLAADDLDGYVAESAAAYDAYGALSAGPAGELGEWAARAGFEVPVDLESARRLYLTWSEALIALERRHGNPTDRTLYLMHCPMAFDNAGGDWFQPNDDLLNPYFGAAMLRCGEQVRESAP